MVEFYLLLLPILLRISRDYYEYKAYILGSTIAKFIAYAILVIIFFYFYYRE